MNYLDKCTFQTNLLFNKLKPSRNIIIFVVSEDYYLAYTLSDMKTIMASFKYHDIQEYSGTLDCLNDLNHQSSTLESFYYLRNRIVVDSSLSICFENKVNTMKLIKTENKFRISFDESDNLTFGYYRVEPMSRRDINSNENSTFDENSTVNKNDKSNYTETIEYDKGITRLLEYENKILKQERWFKNDLPHRDDDLPALITYHDNKNVSCMTWFVDGVLHRNDKPAWISYYKDSSPECVFWFVNGKQHREAGLPAEIIYNKDGSTSVEKWYTHGECTKEQSYD